MSDLIGMVLAFTLASAALFGVLFGIAKAFNAGIRYFEKQHERKVERARLGL